MANAQELDTSIHIVGAMKNVMRKGELFGTLNLDSLRNKEHLYGLGPVDYLRGELMIVDGKCYKSSVLPNGEMKLEETFEVKAPFFGYTQIENWNEIKMPDSIHSIIQLENYLNAKTSNRIRPFFFLMKGKVDQAKIHVVNLPKGSVVHSPEEAHIGQANYTLKNKEVVIVGFFSTEHQTIFTHHSTFVHMHLITNDLLQMGHIDELIITPKRMRLLLPLQ